MCLNNYIGYFYPCHGDIFCILIIVFNNFTVMVTPDLTIPDTEVPDPKNPEKDSGNQVGYIVGGVIVGGVVVVLVVCIVLYRIKKRKAQVA